MNQVPKPSSPAGGPGPGENRPAALVPEAYWESNPGIARGDHNEDAIAGTGIAAPQAASRGYLFIVADGMGGHNAGEVASNQAAQMIYSRYYNDQQPDIHLSLEMAIRSTNAELFGQAQANPAQQGMGTTLTAAVIKDNRLYVAHVGDSRLYLIRGGHPEQVTQDHSWVEEQVRAGVLTRLQAESHPQRNVITRALATAPDVKVDHYLKDLLPGDVIVMCSDGLNTEVGDAQIAAHATKSETAQEAVKRLIQLANDNGGADNVSVAVIRMHEGTAATAAAMTAASAAAAEKTTTRAAVPGARAAAAGPRSKMPVIIAGVAALLILGAVGVALALRSSPVAQTPPPVVTSATVTDALSPTSTPLPAVVPPARPGTALPVSRDATPAGPAAAPAPPSPTLAVFNGPTPETTSTLAPTSTSAPTFTPPPTAKPAQPTLPGAAKPAPGATAYPGNNLPAGSAGLKRGPALGDPNGADLSRPQVTFTWTPVDPLGPTEGYAVLVWRANSQFEGQSGLALPTVFGACDQPPYQATTFTANNITQTYGWSGNGQYKWSVVIVDTAQRDPSGPCKVVSTQPEAHQFLYNEVSGGGGPPPTPAPKPRG